MDDPRATRNNVIFVAVVLVLIGVAVMYVFTGRDSEAVVESSGEYSAVLADVRQIQDLVISGGVLDAQGFKDLKDFSVQVSPTTPPGRANPFLSF